MTIFVLVVLMSMCCFQINVNEPMTGFWVGSGGLLHSREFVEGFWGEEIVEVEQDEEVFFEFGDACDIA